MKKWQKIISVIIGGAIGICLAISLICIFDSKDSSPRLLSMSKFDSGYAEMLFIDQGAWGSYVELKIYDYDMKLMESIFMRSEDTTPSLDSIIGKDVYISYQNLPGNDSILEHERCLLGESLRGKDKLKYNYHFRNIQ